MQKQRLERIIISHKTRARHPRRARVVSGAAIRDALALLAVVALIWLSFDALREWGARLCADAVSEVRVAHYVIRYDPCAARDDAPAIAGWR